MSSKFGVGSSAFRTVRDRSMLTDTVAFPAYTRNAIDRVGRYDEELVRNQDDEYNYRLRKLGGRVLLAADVNCRYYSRGSLRSLWRQFQYGTGKSAYCKSTQGDEDAPVHTGDFVLRCSCR